MLTFLQMQFICIQSIFFVSDYSNPEAVKFFILPKDTMLCCKYGIYARSFDDHFESVYVLTYTSA